MSIVSLPLTVYFFSEARGIVVGRTSSIRKEGRGFKSGEQTSTTRCRIPKSTHWQCNGPYSCTAGVVVNTLISIIDLLVVLSFSSIFSHKYCNNTKMTSAAAADELNSLRARILVRSVSYRESGSHFVFLLKSQMLLQFSTCFRFWSKSVTHYQKYFSKKGHRWVDLGVICYRYNLSV